MKTRWLLATAVGLLAGTTSCGDEQQEASSGQRALGATSADGGVGNVALVGDAVLLVQEGEYTLRVRRVPLDGAQPTTALTVRLSPDKIPSGQLAGSDALAGLVLHTETPTSTLGHSRIFRGPPAGRLVALGPLKPLRPEMDAVVKRRLVWRCVGGHGGVLGSGGRRAMATTDWSL